MTKERIKKIKYWVIEWQNTFPNMLNEEALFALHYDRMITKQELGILTNNKHTQYENI